MLPRLRTRSAPAPRRPPRAAVLALALVGLAAVYAGALALVSLPRVEAALRDRIEATLAARLGEVTVGPDVHVDPLFRVTFGPVTVPAARRAAPPVLLVERVKVRASATALLAGRLEPASIRLYGVRVEAGPSGREALSLAERLRRPGSSPSRPPEATDARPSPAALGAPRDPRSAEPPTAPALHVKGLVATFRLGERAIEVGPLDATFGVERGRDGAERIALDLRLPGHGAGRATLRRDAMGWHAEVELSGLGPQDVPAALRSGPATLAAGDLALRATADADPELTRAGGHVRLIAHGLYLGGERIGRDPVGPLSASAEGDLTWDGAERRLALPAATVTFLGAVPAKVSGQLRLGPGLPFELAVHAEGVDFRAAAAALPPALNLPPEAPHPSGTLDVRIALSGPLVAPAAWTVDAALDLARLREATRRGPPAALRAPFVHRPEVERGAPPSLVIGPQNPDFVALSDLPPHVIRAVTAAEDAGFFGHEGFDFGELRNALAEGAERGRLVRGGSTITQQLAKNLYLTREKTFARKVREAALTVALEAAVPKQRLLEIYLNIAEWGPGVWGIGPAARHWFGVPAQELTPRQAAFLASIIPNPVRYHYMWSRGAPTDGWDQRVDGLLLKLKEQGVLDDDALAAALAERLAFAHAAGALAAP